MPPTSDDADVTGALSSAEVDRRAGLAPRQVGRYLVEAEIGRGGEGVVYAATDLETGKPVALKALPQAYAGDVARRARLEREGRVLTMVDHPGFAAIHGIEETPAGLFLVLELVQGVTLRDRLQGERLSIVNALDIGLQIAAALEAAHELRIVHRDLKPGNIKVTPQGVVKILDFGLAKVVGESDDPAVVGGADAGVETSRAGEIVGTVAYMSPEQTRGEALDRRVDVWAFGCVLFECLSGQRIWAGGTVPATLDAIRAQEPAWGALGPDVPAPVLELLRACLIKDPHRRWIEMGEARMILATALEAAGVVPSELLKRRRRGNLPRQLTSFHGRVGELAQLARLVSAPGLVTVHGWGGTGKTRLALEIAERGEELHPDGAWYVDLTPLADAGRVALAVATVVGVKDTPGQSTEDSLGQFFEGRKALLVLDGCDHVLDGCRALVERFRASCPRLVVLATSREPLLTAGERVLSLQPLALGQADDLSSLESSEAVSFFVARARRAVVGFRLDDDNRRAVLDICRGLDGLPLALELAAARTRWLPVEAVARGVTERLSTIAGAGALAPARHQTLDALVDWSYQNLSEEEKILLRRLAVFAGSWALEAAEAACADAALPETKVVDAVAGLVSRSLLVCERQSGAMRYRLLETVRAYARARLLAAGEDEATLARYLEFYVSLSAHLEPSLTGPDQRDAFARLELEHANLEAALALGARPEAASRGAILAFALIEYWLWRGLAREGHRATVAIAAAGERLGAARGRVEYAIARCAQALDEHGEAGARFAAALEHARASGDQRLSALSLNGLGSVAWNQGEILTAIAHFEAAQALAGDCADLGVSARVLTNRGGAELERGEVERARANWSEAMRLQRQLGDRRSLALLASNLATLEHQQGNVDAAKVLALEALALRRDLRDGPGVALALMALSCSVLPTDPDAGMRHLEDALREFERAGRKEGVALVANNLACLAEDRRDYALAGKWYRESLAVVHAAGFRRHYAALLENFASLAKSEGRFRRSAVLLGAAARLRREAGLPIPPAQQPVVDPAWALACARLGAAVAGAERDRGAALSEGEAVAYALGDDD